MRNRVYLLVVLVSPAAKDPIFENVQFIQISFYFEYRDTDISYKYYIVIHRWNDSANCKSLKLNTKVSTIHKIYYYDKNNLYKM